MILCQLCQDGVACLVNFCKTEFGRRCFSGPVNFQAAVFRSDSVCRCVDRPENGRNLLTLTNFIFPRDHDGSPLFSSPGMAQGFPLELLLAPPPPLLEDFLTGVGSSGPESDVSESLRERFLASLGMVVF